MAANACSVTTRYASIMERSVGMVNMDATQDMRLFSRRGAAEQVRKPARQPASGARSVIGRKAGGGVGDRHDVFLCQFCGVVWPRGVN